MPSPTTSTEHEHDPAGRRRPPTSAPRLSGSTPTRWRARWWPSVARHRARLHGLPGEAGPELERAAARALLNVAEAAGRQGARDRTGVFAIARGKACEAAAALAVAVIFGALTAEQAAPARAALTRLSQMLTRLARPA